MTQIMKDFELYLEKIENSKETDKVCEVCKDTLDTATEHIKTCFVCWSQGYHRKLKA